MKIMITGGSGRLGRELKNVFPEAIIPTHKKLDITSYTKVYDFINTVQPEKIIHAAALTSVRECEKNKDKAWVINVEGTKNIVKAINSINPKIKLIYISTACVFSGEEGAYNELSCPNPKNYYAVTKLIGELTIRELENWLILRTNFVPREPWPYSGAFIDRFGTYLFADDLANAIKDVIKNDLNGLIHITGDTKISMFELAKKVSPDIKPMTLREYIGPPLTVDMSLDTIKWKKYKIT